MDRYYYLITQLPLLDFNSIEHIDIDYFIEQAAKWLSPKDFEIFRRASIDDIYLRKSDNGIVKEYKIFEYNLRDDIVKFREGNIGAILDESLKSVLADTDPLKVEMGLLHLKWSFVDKLESYHNFDLERVIIYLYKLQILDRISQFDKEKGEELFNKISNINYEAMVHEN